MMRVLFALNPPTGYFPDFLTPAEASRGLDAGINGLLSTPKRRLRAEVGQLMTVRAGTAALLSGIGCGDSSALFELGIALRKYYNLVLGPVWPHLSAVFEADRQLRARQMADGGLAGLLDGLAPGSRFRDGVLEVHHFRTDVDVHLDGRGIRLIPSYFKQRGTLMLLADPQLPPVIVYPVDTSTRILTEGRRQLLTALLGRTRAAVIEQAQTAASVSEIAQRLHMSLPAASKHLAVLRRAGLVAGHRPPGPARGPSPVDQPRPLPGLRHGHAPG
jgi:hypothetical protein